MSDIPFFGTAGNADSFFEAGYKDNAQAPEFLSKLGLDAYEFQAGHGMRVSEKKAAELGENAKRYGVRLSIHSPYYISMSGIEEETRLKSIGYILQCAEAARYMGADRIVVHCGSCSKISRQEALELAKDTFAKALSALDGAGFSDITLCPETMGKVNQLGTVEEVVEICRMDERLLPCIDFGHIYARTFGGLVAKEDFAAIFNAMEDKLGLDRLRRFHSHFSHIEYTEKGGEKRHITFAEGLYGPEFEPVAELCVKKGCRPVFICESRGTQAEDACTMKQIYKKTAGGKQ